MDKRDKERKTKKSDSSPSDCSDYCDKEKNEIRKEKNKGEQQPRPSFSDRKGGRKRSKLFWFMVMIGVVILAFLMY